MDAVMTYPTALYYLALVILYGPFALFALGCGLRAGVRWRQA
jgi:hypothetical protein